MRAEEVLPDHTSEREFNGVSIRKGTVAAFIVNAKVIADPAATQAASAAATQDVIESLPALRALGLFDVLAVRDARVRAIVEQGGSQQ